MELNMETLYAVYLGIAFVVLLGPFAFYRFTRLENPDNEDDGYNPYFMGNMGRVLFILALPLYFGICAYLTTYVYMLSYPETTLFDMDLEQWTELIENDAPSYLGIAAVVVMLIFASGTVWGLFVANKRWEAKVWEDPGSMTSKAIRAMSYFMNVYFVPLVLVAAVTILLLLFQERFLTNLAAVPYWLGQAMNRDVNENNQSYLIGYAVIAGIALLFVLWALICMIRAVMSSFWPKTEASITRSELYTYVSGSGRYRSVNHRYLVDYSYLVDGVPYSSDSLSYNTQWLYHNKPYIFRQTKRYPLDGNVQAYVNPSNPNQAVLQAGIDLWGMLVILLHMGFFFILATTFLIPEIIR
jgi:hypothetical protein